MKPIIFPITVDGQGRINISFKELSDLLDKAYTAGKADGGEAHYDCPYQPWIINPVSPNPSQTGYATDRVIVGDGDSTSTTTTTATAIISN